MPIEDERSKRVKQRAGYCAFLGGIWFNLLLAWGNEMLIEDFGMSGIITRHALELSILAMAIFFFVSWFYFNRKEDV